MQNVTKILIPRQLFMMLVLSTGLLNHVILIPNLLNAAGRDSWLSVIIAYPIAIIFLWLVYFIAKNSSDQGFFPMVEKRFGKLVSAILSFPVVLFLFTASYITLRDLMIWLNAYFLSDASITMINFIMILVCFIVTLGGIKYMAITSGFLLPLVMLFGIFIAITNTSIKDPSLLFPLLSEGYMPVFKGVIYTLSGLLEIYIIVLLQPYSQSPIKFHQLFILLTILAGLILGPLTAAIMEFGPVESAFFRYPAYEQWRVLTIGEYISHLDFFALYQWLSGAVIRIGLFIYLAAAFFTKKKKHYKLNPILVGGIYLIFFGVMWIEVETFYFYEFIYRYFLPACMAFFLFQILISALLIIVMRKREESYDKYNKSGS